jgi:hypothetical protein
MSTIANAIGALKTSSAPAPTTPMLRAIPDAENFGARTAYKGKGIVEATFALRRGEGQPRYEKDCVFDFSKVSEEQLHLLAMYGAKVKVQALLRAMSQDAMLNPKTLQRVDVLADVLEASRQPKDPIEAAVRSMTKALGITEEKARAMLATASADADKADKKVAKK